MLQFIAFNETRWQHYYGYHSYLRLFFALQHWPLPPLFLPPCSAFGRVSKALPLQFNK